MKGKLFLVTVPPMSFPFEYAAVQDVPVTLTIDPRRFARTTPKRSLRSPDEITGLKSPEPSKLSNASKVSESPKTTAVKNRNPSKADISRITESIRNVSLNQLPDASLSDTEKGKELSLLYLPDDTAERRAAFSRLYLATREIQPTDMDVLRAFFLFEGEVEGAVKYLTAFISLNEFGFPEDQISTALLLYKNNMEEALEHLMKNS
ncbi:hypothetical protein PSACC_01967 [Paramicrosporidium saccamoebae]|uniref:UBA domain-containing protein n=1 Tax=Paramicrosporidium saccamoebae TaxID=1246581 RepID=A0A2H9TKP7_9FUNG|nr:hypothetical protein PSACC_01967 [Paramicrosporidium saccamoebae]